MKEVMQLRGPAAQLNEDYGTVYYMEDRAQERLDDTENFWFPYVTDFTYYPNVTFMVEEAKWDNYLAQLDNIGLQQVLDVWQTAYDRYQEAL